MNPLSKESLFMKNKTLAYSIVAAFLLLAGGIHAEEFPTVNPDHPKEYTVVKGDTLWSIAGRFLKEPWRWPEIWKTNPQVENPHLIYPSDVISLIWDGDRPILAVNGAGSTGESRESANRHIKLTPDVDIRKRKEAIHEIPLNVIQGFLTQHILLDKTEFEIWPYVTGNEFNSIIATVGNTVFIKNLPPNTEVGSRFEVYRLGSALVLDSTEGNGNPSHEAVYLGKVAITSVDEEVSAAEIVSARQEISGGDRLVPIKTVSESHQGRYIPKLPSNMVQGRIISLLSGAKMSSKYQIVLLDVGRSDGLEAGNVLGIYDYNKEAGDPVAATPSALDKAPSNTRFSSNESAKEKGYSIKLPSQGIGVAMVIKVYKQFSYALIMESREPIRLYHFIRNL
ncbi:MAG: LysM peptidoglycan-binding domain-containing protein [Candidatus Eutrophobiaceae bacterium]